MNISGSQVSAAALGLFSALTLARAELADGDHELGGELMSVRTVAANLNRPWGLAFLPGGDLLVTEKNGGLRRLRRGLGEAAKVDGLPEDLDVRMMNAIDNTGLFDVAVDPRYERTRRIFLSYAARGAAGSALRVVSFRLEGHQLSDAQQVLQVGPPSTDRFHYGGGLLFDTDDTLLVTAGERYEREKMQDGIPVAQSMSDMRGKILRIRRDGRAPVDNPKFAGSEASPSIHALGVRNPQGLARDPRSGLIWFSEHGPLKGDELNILRPGANYGWPQTSCGIYKDRDYRPPARDTSADAAPRKCWSEQTFAPAGIAFYDGEAFPSWRGKLLVAGLSAGRLLLVDIEGTEVGAVEAMLIDTPTRLRDVAVASDGSVYLAVDGEQGRVVRLSSRRPASGVGSRPEAS